MSPGFYCLKCGRCCRGRGGIWLTEKGRRRAASSLGQPAAEFTRRCLEWDRGLWSVKTGPDGHCLLWERSGCRIQRAKPLMCQAWPFFYGPLIDERSFLEAKAACPGLRDWDWGRLKAEAPAKPPKSFRDRLLSLENEGQ